MAVSGFNPMRWRCDTDGCFNEKRRPKIEAFADCFPRRINFGDVDGLVELNGAFCLLEWKGEGGSVKRGQTITYTTWTSTIGNIVFVIEGNAQTMVVCRYCVFWAGKQRAWIDADLDAVKARIREWGRWVQSTRRAA